jgi:TRAP-type C4-dicarboxylate transport system permease small subunit
MMMLGTVDVVGRYLFNRPITGTLEMFEMLLPVLVLFSLADTQSNDEHLTAGVIDFFHFKPETRTKIRFGVQILVFCLFLLIIWRGVESSMLTLRSHRRINNIELPLWIPQLVVPLGALVMCMVLVVQMVETANKIRRKT